MRSLSARFAQRCRKCGGTIDIDSEILYDDETKRAYHPGCVPSELGGLMGQLEGVELADRLGFRPHEELCPDRVLRDLHSAD